MEKKSSSTSIPALKRPDGVWLLDAREKADHFTEVFAGKCNLPVPVRQSTEIKAAPLQQRLGSLPDEKIAFEKLRTLDDDSALGPDLLPTRLLRMCASALAKPVAWLARRIIQWGMA